MISLRQAKRLQLGDILYAVNATNADGTPLRWRVNGRVKTWKRRPDKVRVPIKHGLYSYDYLTENRLDLVSSTEKQAIRHRS
jgi:hypothetical protein